MLRQITEAMYPFSAHQSEVKRMPQANSKVYLDRPWNGRANKTYFRDHQKDLEESWSIWTVIYVRACWSHGSTDFSTFMTWPFKGRLLQRGGISSWILSIQPSQPINPGISKLSALEISEICYAESNLSIGGSNDWGRYISGSFWVQICQDTSWPFLVAYLILVTTFTSQGGLPPLPKRPSPPAGL